MTITHKVLLTCLMATGCFVSPAGALPVGERVISGDAVFSRESQQLTVEQRTDKVIVDYDQFSIGQPETVVFQQPDASSVALNRVVDAQFPSEILGSLQANGRIFLVNPRGILFGQGARVDAAGLVASTLDISNADFLNGKYHFAGQGGAVINLGNLSAPGGFVALLGTNVRNAGVISAELGSVALAGGEAVTLNLDNQGLISAVIEEPVSSNPDGRREPVSNTGTLQANGGRVLMTAETLDDVFDYALNTEGVIEASRLTERNGEIVLQASHDVRVAGSLSGGNIAVAAEAGDVTHLPGSVVETDGGNFRGMAGRDYVLNNGAQLDTGTGTIDLLAARNIILGQGENQTVRTFDWRYILGRRVYEFKEFGYYVVNDAGELVYVPVVEGLDIGKDGDAATSGSGVAFEGEDGFDFYTRYFTHRAEFGKFRLWHTEADRNIDGQNHVRINGEQYSWEDIKDLGDADFDDVVIEFTSEIQTYVPGVSRFSGGDVFLTARDGRIKQAGGEIRAENLVLSSALGMTGDGPQGALQVSAGQLSAVNRTQGDIRIAANDSLVVRDLSGLVGLNDGVRGVDGVVNAAPGGEVLLTAGENLDIDALIGSRGNTNLEAGGNVRLGNEARIVMTADEDLPKVDIVNLRSTSHEPETWSNDDTVDTAWEIDVQDVASRYRLQIDGGQEVSMAPGANITTQDSDIEVTAGSDVAVSRMDAGLGTLAATSRNGSIVDVDAGQEAGAADLIARSITLTAPNGSVAVFDLGSPFVFASLWDRDADGIPDTRDEDVAAERNADGSWTFRDTGPALPDSDRWWFHVQAVKDPGQAPLIALGAKADTGPYFVDTTPPEIQAGTPQGLRGPDGQFHSGVTVPFTATDNLSGFDPDGSRSKGLNPASTSGVGSELFVTSEGVTDRAGNFTPGISVGPFAVGLLTRGAELLESSLNEVSVYYEILKPSQYLSFEPVTKVGLYAYHPITETDQSAFDDIQLDAGAYEFIQENINLRQNAAPYFGLDESEK